MNSDRLVPLIIESKPNWEGLHSEKFNLVERKHFTIKDQMDGIHGQDPPILGRKHFESKRSPQFEDKLCLKVFPDKQNRESNWTEQVTLKKMAYIPPQKRYGHKEKRHLAQTASASLMPKPVIRTFETANQPSTKTHELEIQMGRKGLIEPLFGTRNDIPVASMGDKSYKYPEYAPGFYKEGGLIPGSSMPNDKVKKYKRDIKKVKGTLFPGRLTWKQKEEIAQRQDEVKAVLDLGDWEKTTLKEANPKWRDPDDFELDPQPKPDVTKKMSRK